MEHLISVIVPIYNVEKYLSKCVDSIINQTYKNLEIILVDDGSPDNCPKICDEYENQDSRIKVIHKENGGLSDARNAGMKIASGDYIFFVDSDDWISVDTLYRLLDSAEQYGADIAECNIYSVKDNRTEEYYSNKFALYDNNYSIMQAYIKDYKIKTVVWNKLYKKDILKNILFEVGKYNEDEFFTYRVLSNSERLVHIDYCGYYYIQRGNSIMGENYSLKKLDSLEGFAKRASFVKDNYPDLYFFELNSVTFACINHYQTILKNKQVDNNKEGRKKIKAIKKQFKWDYNNFCKLNKKDKMYILLSVFSLGLCARIRNLLNKGG